MKSTGYYLGLHLLRVVAISAVLILGMAYPFLPGVYDIFAMPVSTGIQVASVLLVPLIPLGFFWLVYEIIAHRRRKRGLLFRNWSYGLGLTASGLATVGGLLLCLVAVIAFGKLSGVICLVLLLWGLYRVLPALQTLRQPIRIHPAPLYLVLIPVILLTAEWVMAGPLTASSRNQAIVNSQEYRNAIDGYRTRYGSYPASLQAQWKDFQPGITGVEKYHYTSYGESYNLFFEQPRFLIDQFGTREWVVYNPRDQHMMISHTAWLLNSTPDQLMNRQGWYVSHNAPQAHWKFFWFD